MVRYVVICFVLCSLNVKAQSVQQSQITVRKEKTFIKATFDEKNSRLLAIDKYGNANDTAIIFFRMLLSVEGMNNVDSSNSSQLTATMAQWIKVAYNKANIRFYDIKARDKNGNIIELPNMVYTIHSKENQDSD